MKYQEIVHIIVIPNKNALHQNNSFAFNDFRITSVFAILIFCKYQNKFLWNLIITNVKDIEVEVTFHGILIYLKCLQITPCACGISGCVDQWHCSLQMRRSFPTSPSSELTCRWVGSLWKMNVFHCNKYIRCFKLRGSSTFKCIL